MANNQWKPTPISDDDWNAISGSNNIDTTNDITDKTVDKATKKVATNTLWKPQAINDDDWNNITSSVGEIKVPEPIINKDDPDFIPGVLRGVDQLQAMGHGAVALTGSGLKKIGLEETGQKVQEFGLEGYRRNIEEAGQHPKKYSFKDVYTGEAGFGGAIDWVQGTLGELVPSMVEAAAGAIVGSFVAPGVGTAAGGLAGRTILRKSIEKATQEFVKASAGKVSADQARKQITKASLKKLGGKVGIGAAVMPMESGGMYAELFEDHGIDAPETALLFGGLATSLEFFGGNSKLVDVFVDSLVNGAKKTAKKSAREIIQNIPEEALQEGGQEVFNILNTVVNTDEELFTLENVERIIESMGAGAVGGGAGAVMQAATNVRETSGADVNPEVIKKVENILSQGDEQVRQFLNTLNEKIVTNQVTLDNPEALTNQATELNISPEELTTQLQEQNVENEQIVQQLNEKFGINIVSKAKTAEDIIVRDTDIISKQGNLYKVKSPLVKRLGMMSDGDQYEIIQTPDGFIGRKIDQDSKSSFKDEQQVVNGATQLAFSDEDVSLSSPIEQLDILKDGVKTKQEFEKLGTRGFIKQYGSKELKGSYFILETLLPEGTLEDVNLEVDPGKHLFGALGEYLPSDKLVKLYNTRASGKSVNSDAFANTLLHEIVHAKIYEKLQYNFEIQAELDGLRATVANKLLSASEIEIYNKYKNDANAFNNYIFESKKDNKSFQDMGLEDNTKARLIYMLLNNDELLANATHPDMQKALSKVSVPFKQKFMDTVKAIFKRLFGWSNQEWTAYEQAMSAIGRLNQEKEFEILDESGKIVTELDQISVQDLAETQDETIPEQTIPQAEYDRVFNQRKNLLQKIKQTIKMRFHDVKLLADKSLGSISTRLKNISPMLSAKIRTLDFITSQRIVKALKVAQPLLEATKGMSKPDKSAWDWARKNSDSVKIKEIAEKYGMTEQIEELREVMNNLRKEAIDVGYDVGFIDEYWPRAIKNQEGFLQATQEISQRPIFTDAIKAQAKKLGITTEKFERDYPEVKADIISNLILGHTTGIGGPGSTQSRVFKEIPEEYAEFYMDSDAALMQYIYSMTKKIEARKFFGKVPKQITALKTKKKQAQANLIKYEQLVEQFSVESPDRVPVFQDRVNELNSTIIEIDHKLNEYKYQRDYTENIGTYIDDLRISGELHKKDEKTVKDILEARFTEHGTTGIVNAYKNLAYIDTMGSPISAVTQIGDLAWAMYVGKVWTPKGFSDTIKNIVKATLNRSNITKEDLGIERIAQEFADGTTLSNAVSFVFKKVGLEKMDSIGKETLVNNALAQYKLQAENDPTGLARQIRPIFGPQTNNVVNSLLAYNPSDANQTISDESLANIQLLVYSRLLDFQPVALSEMPEHYLKGGNWRVLYMLKTYTLKQFDMFRKEVWHNIKSGNPKQIQTGITNMVQLMALLTLANASADEIKDFMLGKETKFSDHVIENFLSIGGANRYVKMQITREGIGSALAQQILPPFKFFNSISKDISGNVEDGWRSIESIPGVGKLYYWRSGRGAERKKSINEKEFAKVGKDVRKFKKQFEKAEDKRTFLQANSDELKQMNLHKNFSAALSRNKAVINKLKKIPQTVNVRKRLGQLENQREMILETYFKVAEKLK